MVLNIFGAIVFSIVVAILMVVSYLAGVEVGKRRGRRKD